MASPVTPLLLTLSDLERSKSRSLGFQDLISRKGAELSPILLLTINRKAYMASLITSSLWTLGDLERSKSKSLRFQRLISRTGAELNPMLLLTINRKSYMASLMTPSLLTLSELGTMLILTVNRKRYLASLMTPIYFLSMSMSKSMSLRFLVVGYLYGIDIFVSSNITTIWMSQKSVCWRAGFSAVSAVFLVSILLF